MKALWKEFSTYAVIGVANTLIHWQLFYVLTTAAELSQAVSNFSAFCVAASFSFYVNALYTIDSKTSIPAYLALMGGMGLLSYGIGHVADVLDWPGVLTVTLFSLLSLMCGFFFWKFVVFRDCEL